MKTKFLLIVAGLAIVAVGCVRTVSGKRTAAVPLVKDRIEGRYARPASQVFDAAKEVIRLNGTLSSEGTLHSGTNVGGVLVLEGRVNADVNMPGSLPPLRGPCQARKSREGLNSS